MFATDDDYAKAIKNSSIHIHSDNLETKPKSKAWFFLSILPIIGYLGYNNYFIKETSFLRETSKQVKTLAQLENNINPPTIVMGATHTSNISDIEDEYIAALDNMQVDVLTHKIEDINNEMNIIVNAETISVNNSKYTKQLTKELEAEEIERVIIVEEGDTLASLSIKYYGDARKYNKIIANNDNLHDNGDTIYVGQKINLPY